MNPRSDARSLDPSAKPADGDACAVARFLRNPWVTWIASITLGCVFIYSAYHKIDDPPDFAKSVHNYYVVPGIFVNFVAIYMPWFELVGGVALAVGVLRRGGALGFGLLTLVFILVLGFNVYRGHPTICGCFGKFADGIEWTDAMKFEKMVTEILLDVGLLLLSAQVFYASLRSKPRTPEAA
jgi:uncharacterized membrane protein YphA (DoxX/SURF4 family)